MEPSTTRRCLVCKGPSHHLCSNELRASVDGEATSDSHALCSKECFCKSRHAENEKVEGLMRQFTTSLYNPDDDSNDSKDEENTIPISSRRYNNHTINFRREVIAFWLKTRMSYGAVAKYFGTSKTNVARWLSQRDKLATDSSNLKAKRFRGGGRISILTPFTDAILQFMKDERRKQKPLRAVHIAQFLTANSPEFVNSYLENSDMDSLLRCIRRFAAANVQSREN